MQQVKPEKITEEGAEKSPSRNAPPYLLKIEQCPEGTVPIVRATKEDLLMAKHLPSYLAELSPGMKDINATGRMVCNITDFIIFLETTSFHLTRVLDLVCSSVVPRPKLRGKRSDQRVVAVGLARPAQRGHYLDSERS